MHDDAAALERGDPLGWEEAFTVLAVRRCSRFFAEMGLPGAMVRSPEPLVSTARAVMMASESMAGSSNDEYVRHLASVRKEAFRQLHEPYDVAVVHALTSWVMRYSVDDLQRKRWWQWSILLPQLATSWKRDDAISPSPLSHSKVALITEIADRWLSSTRLDRLERRIKRAGSVPLDDDERHWVHVHDLTEPSDLIHVKMITIANYTYSAWNDLKKNLSDSEQALLVDSARQVATAMQLGVRANEVHIPPS